MGEAAQVAAGRPMAQVVAGYGKAATGRREQVMAQALKMVMSDQGVDSKRAGQILAQRSIDFAAGRAADIGAAKIETGTLLGQSRTNAQLDLLLSEMPKLVSSGGAPILNKPIGALRSAMGDVKYNQLRTYVNSAANDYARVVSGGTLSVAQLQGHNKEEVDKLLNPDMTAAQLTGQIEAMKKEMGATIKGTREFTQRDRGGKEGGAMSLDAYLKSQGH